MGNYQEMPSLLASSSVQDFLVVILVAVIACSTAIPERFHPLTLLHLLALRLAEKVHPDTRRSVFQQRLSGVLAPIVLIVPFLICIALAFQIVEFPIIFEALVLLCVHKPIMAINRSFNVNLNWKKKLSQAYNSDISVARNGYLIRNGIGEMALRPLSFALL